MCGIAALLSCSSKLSLNHIQAMTILVEHRGRDDEGYVLLNHLDPPLVLGGCATPHSVLGASYPYSPVKCVLESDQKGHNVLLGHRRLSVLDLSAAGHQPMCSEDKRYWITYNGEVYNSEEIREELESMGWFFFSQSDTEVVLIAYQTWGKDCLQRFNGMFSFVIYDRHTRTGFAARDRFGIKPLYYWSNEGFIAFASEIKQFTPLPGWRSVGHDQLIYEYLMTGITDFSAETLFLDVLQLRGGECCHIDLNGPHPVLNTSRWYDVPARNYSYSEQEAATRFIDLLKSSVQLHLKADVGAGFCLSGGLDSSSLVCLASQLIGKEDGYSLQTFTASFDDRLFDESSYAEMVNRQCRLESHFVYPTGEDLASMMREIVWHQDEPFASTSIYAQWKVFRLVRDRSVKVVLNGQGADELLAGYNKFFYSRFYELSHFFTWGEYIREICCLGRRHLQSTTGIRRLMSYLRKRTVVLNRKLFGAFPERNYLDVSRLNADPLAFWTNPSKQTVEEFSRCQLMRSSLPMLLRFEDRNSMANTVESRLPFLDYRLVEFLLSIPSHYKISRGVTKRILRTSLKGVIPEPIRLRADKIGFATPEATWIRKQGREICLEGIGLAIERSNGLIKPTTMDFAKSILLGNSEYEGVVWRLMNVGLWAERFDLVLN